jgi:hypothetical protein
VIGIRLLQDASIFSATISISRWGNDGNRAVSRWVRSPRKFINARAFVVTYMELKMFTGRTMRATSRATPALSMARYWA